MPCRGVSAVDKSYFKNTVRNENIIYVVYILYTCYLVVHNILSSVRHVPRVRDHYTSIHTVVCSDASTDRGCVFSRTTGLSDLSSGGYNCILHARTLIYTTHIIYKYPPTHIAHPYVTRNPSPVSIVDLQYCRVSPKSLLPDTSSRTI